MNTQLLEELRQPWLITEAVLAGLAQAIMNGEVLPKGVIPEAVAQQRPSGAVAVIPIYGPTTKKPTLLAQLFGINLPTTEGIGAMVRQAAADPSVSAIVLDFDSPGGTVEGVDELANIIFQARAQKTIIAYANGYMCSAAYYYGSAATAVVASPDAQVGSIGTILMHLDFTKQAEMEGVTPTIITSSPKKAQFHPLKTLTEEDKARMQEVVDFYNGRFVKAVARNRGVSASVVKSQYGEGAVLMAQEGLAAGMVDKIGSFDDALKMAVMGGKALKAVAVDAFMTVEEFESAMTSITTPLESTPDTTITLGVEADETSVTLTEERKRKLDVLRA